MPTSAQATASAITASRTSSARPKPAAGFYKSQCDPAEEVVLEPAFHWASSDEAIHFTKAVVCSNCDHLKFYLREQSLESNPWKLIAELDPDREEFEHLTYPPFVLDLIKLDRSQFGIAWGDLRIDGFIKGKQVISKSLSGAGDNESSLSCQTIAPLWRTVPTPRASSFASPISSMPSAPTPTTPSSSRWRARPN